MLTFNWKGANYAIKLSKGPFLGSWLRFLASVEYLVH